MPSVRPNGSAGSKGPGTDNLSGLHDNSNPVVPDRTPEPENRDAYPAHAKLHIALIVPDIKVYGAIRQNAWLLSPPDWDGTVKLHVLLKGKDDPNGILLRYLAREAELATSKAAKLLYPEDLELGWSE